MLPESQDYESLYNSFTWPMPERFNIAREICDRWAQREPDRLALIYKRPDGALEHYSYGDLFRAANRLASALRKGGIGKRDRVALLLQQSPQTAISHIAIYKLGAVAVPLASLFGPEALEYRLNNAEVGTLITDAPGLEKIASIRDRLTHLTRIICVEGPSGEAEGFDDICAGEPDEFPTCDTAPDDWAVMVYTSGTTGQPKGALHAQRVLLGHLPGVEYSHNFFPGDGDLMWTPADWAWAGGLFNIMLPSLYYGVPLLAHAFTKFDPEAAFALMEEAGVRNAFIPPTALRMLRAVERPAERYKLSLRTIASGGESLGRETLEWGESALGLTINEFYGQTECNYVLSSCAPLGVVKPGSIGKPVPGHVVAVIAPDGSELPPGEQGQIAIRNPDPNMFLEYWKRPEATREKFIGDWMTTGDQGVMDEEGYISFVGRDDDVITSAGFRIGPGEIEDCLLKHPAVRLAAAVGKPDPVRTEIVKAFIVLKEGYSKTPELEKELGTFVRERLSAHEYPREIAFIDEMPLTTTGKVIRRLLREQA
ncbi:MAG: AMP-dependent synthetase [Alphaproteobacteria bacterium]|nr:MAG: AMP-dependent synthetase [Alphaproteobacteria bacterium]